MIKKTDLRIGNFVSDIHASPGYMWEVTELLTTICNYAGFASKYKDIMPVKLTQEFFTNVDAAVNVNGWYAFSEEGFDFNVFSGQCVNSHSGTDLNHEPILSVHEFQNWYRSYTGKELEIKKQKNPRA